MVWVCDAKGGDPHNKTHMRWLDRLKSDMHINVINPEMTTDRERWSVMVKNVDNTQMVEDGKRFVTVSTVPRIVRPDDVLTGTRRK